MARAIIEARHIRKAYNGKLAVRDLSFDVEEGEIFGFLGPNGAGKSTTLKLLLGLLPLDAGHAHIAGYSVARHPKSIHRLSGVAFEISNLYERLTARENLAFFARLAGVPLSAVDWALEAVNLAGRADDPVHTFSRGMRQRLILARAIIHRPRLLFLDEPTAGLDPNAAADIRALIESFRDRDGMTVFLTTHDMMEAEQLCRRVGIIHEGRLVACDTVDRLRARWGQSTVRLTRIDGPTPATYRFPRSDPAWIHLADEYRQQGRPFHIRSEEATLAQVFRRLTGHDLDDEEEGSSADEH